MFKTKDDFILEAQIVHQNKFDYSQIDYIDSNSKITLNCAKHGDFSISPCQHVFCKKACSKCPKKVSKYETLWLDDIKLPSSKENRNVTIAINKVKYFVDGFNPTTKTIYLYLKDYWQSNLEVHDASEIHSLLNKSFKELSDLTKARIDFFVASGYSVVTKWESDFLKEYSGKCKIVVHDNKHAQLVITDKTIFNKIRNALSFKAEGVEYTAAFRAGWNGITFLMDNHGYFMLGIINKVKELLTTEGMIFEQVDKRPEVILEKSIDLTKRLEDLKFEVRDYQQRVVNVAQAHDKGIIRAATGAGKSLIAALLTAKLNKPTIIYVIGLDLLKQFHDLFSSIFDEKIGYIGNGVIDMQRINVASIWTVSSALKNKSPIIDDDELSDKEKAPSEYQCKSILEMLQQTKVHMFDESHVVTTDTIKSIFNVIDPEHIYGFSGTPYRDDGSDLLVNGILGEKIVDVSASELIKKGFLAQPLIKFVRVPKTYNGTGTTSYQTVYKEYVTENEIRNRLIIKESLALLTKGYQVLILFKHLQHGKNLREILDNQKIDYEFLSGTDSLEVRTKAKNNLLSRKSNLVLASTIFDIGVDIKTLSALVLAGGGKSSIRTLQRVGRVIRKNDGKVHAAIVDFYDDVKFLKGHTKKRFKIYSSEEGFKIIIPKNITDL